AGQRPKRDGGREDVQRASSLFSYPLLISSNGLAFVDCTNYQYSDWGMVESGEGWVRRFQSHPSRKSAGRMGHPQFICLPCPQKRGISAPRTRNSPWGPRTWGTRAFLYPTLPAKTREKWGNRNSCVSQV